MVMATIEFKNLNFVYQENTPFAFQALTDVNLKITDGSYTAIIGHTGSGKSTLIQQMDGLLQPTSGMMTVDDININSQSSSKELAQLRKHIGIVFQFPESQLFEETVIQDVSFGPKNIGFDDDQALSAARNALRLVGLDSSFEAQSPFELSGGQMRRVAIAGVLAMQPTTLILDEPTAGLDPTGQEEMMTLFNALHQTQNMTIILVTHQMEDAAKYADQVVVMNQGKIVATDQPEKIFANQQLLKENHLDVPKTTMFAQALSDKGYQFEPFPLTVHQLATQIMQQIGEAK